MTESEMDVSRTSVRNLNDVAELSLDDSANLYESEYQPPEGADEGDLASGPMNETVRIDKNDRSLSEFRRWHDDGRLIIDPEWQRSYVWDTKRASKLIESFLKDIPVPVIYLAKTADGKYEVIDGVQRLTSIFNFFSNEFELHGLELMPELNKSNFASLPAPLQSKLYDATLRTFELSPQTSKNLLFIIFQRLNSGGVALNEMEIRNCVYSGALNSLIRKLAETEAFVKAVHQSDISRRMTDRSLVLRFLAFYERTYGKAQNGLKSFLNEFCETYRNPLPAKLQEFDQRFRRAVQAAYTIFGSEAFRLRRQDARGGGEWATRVNASIFQVITVSFADYDVAHLAQRSDSIFEEYLDLVTTDSYWVDCVTKSTGDATKIKYAFSTWMERLKSLMDGARPLDTQRLFSLSLKRELFQQDSTCQLCGQAIKTMNDAVLDHIEHYWRGGQTIPTNARLAHRICNLQRPK